MGLPNFNKWNWWEIPLGIATGGSSALAHAGLQATQNLGTAIGQPIGTALGQLGNQLQDNTQDYNSAEAEKQRNWEREMSNTEIQRRVQDIKAAGLNPWLALQGGMGGASTPSGAVASANTSSAQAQLTSSVTQTVVNAIVRIASSGMNMLGSALRGL